MLHIQISKLRNVQIVACMNSALVTCNKLDPIEAKSPQFSKESLSCTVAGCTTGCRFPQRILLGGSNIKKPGEAKFPMTPVHHSYPSLASLRGPFRCIVDFKSGCFFQLRSYAADANFKTVTLNCFTGIAVTKHCNFV